MIDASHAFYTSCSGYPFGTAESGFGQLIFKINDAITKEVYSSEGKFGLQFPLSEDEETEKKMRFAHDRVKSFVRYYESKGFRVWGETKISQTGRVWIGW